MHMWQSRVEIEHYSIAYFERITAFEALYTQRVWAPPVTRKYCFTALRTREIRHGIMFDFYLGLPHICWGRSWKTVLHGNNYVDWKKTICSFPGLHHPEIWLLYLCIGSNQILKIVKSRVPVRHWLSVYDFIINAPSSENLLYNNVQNSDSWKSNYGSIAVLEWGAKIDTILHLCTIKICVTLFEVPVPQVTKQGWSFQNKVITCLLLFVLCQGWQ